MLNSPVTLVQWATEEGGHGGGGGLGVASSSAKTYWDGHPSHPCVVEYSTTRNSTRGPLVGEGSENEREESCTRRIRCKRVVVTVSLGVLKVQKILDSCLKHPDSWVLCDCLSVPQTVVLFGWWLVTATQRRSMARGFYNNGLRVGERHVLAVQVSSR